MAQGERGRGHDLYGILVERPSPELEQWSFRPGHGLDLERRKVCRGLCATNVGFRNDTHGRIPNRQRLPLLGAVALEPQTCVAIVRILQRRDQGGAPERFALLVALPALDV